MADLNLTARIFENGSIQCAHLRVSPTKEIRGDVTTTVYGEHWRCENCNLEFIPNVLAPVQKPVTKEQPRG